MLTQSCANASLRVSEVAFTVHSLPSSVNFMCYDPCSDLTSMTDRATIVFWCPRSVLHKSYTLTMRKTWPRAKHTWPRPMSVSIKQKVGVHLSQDERLRRFDLEGQYRLVPPMFGTTNPFLVLHAIGPLHRCIVCHNNENVHRIDCGTITCL